MRLTLDHFYRTGLQDCSNVISREDFNLVEGVSAVETVDAEMSAEDWADPGEWIAQYDAEDFEGLDPIACYLSWRSGWRSRAIEIVGEWIARRSGDES